MASIIRCLTGWTIALLGLCLTASARPSGDLQVKPFRVLLVIADQWKDPTSTLVSEGGEFQELVTILKSWSIPFDIVRLDQERLSLNHFLDIDRKPRYGAILWDAEQKASLLKQDYRVLAQAVQDYHIGLIALANRIQEPIIQGLLGIRFLDQHPHSSDLKIVGAHFLTAGLTDPLDSGDVPSANKQREQVTVENAQVLVKQGSFPQVTVRNLDPVTHAIWIGGDSTRMFSYQPVRTLLRRALTWTIGYSLVKTWKDHIILMMDDFGNAQNAWLEHWHYPTLSLEQIRRDLIQPLQKNSAVLVVNVLPGFVDDAAQQIMPSWQQTFTDAYGTVQNYRSTKQGLDEGLKLGVIEIHSHGWTHMQPDLDSPPGPWWGSPIDGERTEVGWYREFYDVRRNAEIPAATQRFHLRQSKDWIQHQFGIEPLSVATGGNAVSTSFANNTWRIAAREGFGWYGGYLGEDFVVQGNANATAPLGGTEEVPLILPAPPDGHDQGIVHNPAAFAAVFQRFPGSRFMGLDEYIGYLHTRITSTGPFGLEISHHPKFGRFLQTHGSQYTLHLADWMQEQMRGKNWQLEIDGKGQQFTLQEWTKIQLTAGQRDHRLSIHALSP